MALPFTVSSDIDLGDRLTYAPSAHGDVTIAEGDVPEAIEATSDGAGYQLSQREFLLRVPDGSRIIVRDGQSITYSRGPDTGDRDIGLFIAGTGFGVLGYQRGLISIHASANLAQGRIVAFTGNSGEGKSTLATNLALRGYPFFTDDTLVFDPAGGGGKPLCHAGQKQLKLWGDAVSATGVEALQPVREVLNPIDKHFAVPPSPSAETSGLLTHLYVLRTARGEREGDNEIVALQGPRALQAIRRNLYRPHLAEPIMGRKALFNGLKVLLENVEVATFFRLKSKDNYQPSIDFIANAIGPA